MESGTTKTLLFGALDWGLGHATRSIPVLRHFEERGWKLVIAANAGTKQILQEAFPIAQVVEAPAYNVRYSKQPFFLTLRLLQQAPRIKRVIFIENGWVREIINAQKIDLILSDNRYGFYHPSVPSWIMTHQLSPISGMGSWADALVRWQHYQLLKPFDQILVPDISATPGIAGRLSHPRSIPPSTHYIGLLSRLEVPTLEVPTLEVPTLEVPTLEVPTLEVPTLEVPTLEVLVVLSGPEPSRTIFEQKIRQQLKRFSGSYTLVQGLPNQAQTEPNIIPYADPQTLTGLMQKAELVICRSGYSSVMDLLALGKKAVLVPTPGQTEQLYLADHLEKNGWFPTLRQEVFDLETAIQKAKAFDPPSMGDAFAQYKPILDALIHEL